MISATSLTSSALIAELTVATARACAAIMDIRRAGPAVRMKSDRSPVTSADEAADEIILGALARLLPGVPLISEETYAGGRCPDISGGVFALVDPLDGTREFVAGRDEFTTNIALIAGGTPVAGIIGAPATGTVWRGAVGKGAERLSMAGDGHSVSEPQAIHTRARPAGGLVAVVSRSHLDAETVAFLDAHGITQRITSGSSLKFCRVAEGAADIYPRLAPIHEWDIAAGHAIVQAAGGIMLTESGSRLHYGQVDCGLDVTSFIAYGDATLAERR
jgi:3'(2'), 5'-bisphosphate nucleotidase